jgi:hypothetical protein
VTTGAHDVAGPKRCTAASTADVENDLFLLQNREVQQRVFDWTHDRVESLGIISWAMIRIDGDGGAVIAAGVDDADFTT